MTLLDFEKRSVRQILYILLPLLVLLTDFMVFPVIFESRRPSGNIGIAPLLVRQTLPLGSFKAQRVHVSIDSIQNPRFLNYVKGQGNALVISHFIEPESSSSTSGELGKSVLDKLHDLSAGDYRALNDLFGELHKHSPGDILHFALHDVPKKEYRRFPIDHLFIALFEKGNDSKEKRSEISKVFPELMKMADKQNISALIIPSLAYNWADKHSITFDDSFRPFFEALHLTNRPRDIYLALYSEWPTFALEDAVRSLNAAYERYENLYESSPVFYRGDFRLALILVSLCLVVSSYYTSLTFMHFIIIGCGLFTSLISSLKVVEFITPGFSSRVRSLVQIVVWIALCVFFPILPRLSPKNIFTNDKE